MKIAVVGGGVSGLVSALLLGEEHDVTLFEANDYFGGHTHTVDVSLNGKYAVDTGFIVFNYENYIGFVKLLNRLKVDAKPSSMSFSVLNNETQLEYGFTNWNTVFAQRVNLFRPSFLKMLLEIKRFRSQFDYLARDLQDDVELGAYLDENGYSEMFKKNFIIPFGAAIWSAAPAQFQHFPLRTFVQFFLNHGFLDLKRMLQWHVVKGGSRSYVTELLKQFQGRLCAQSPVSAVRRDSTGVSVVANQSEQNFDHVVLACHSDQALALLGENATAKEREILSALPYQKNNVVLHTDTNVLPSRRHVWSSWNYCVSDENPDSATLTYDMNILQGLKAQDEFLVTLNAVRDIDENRVLQRLVYDHPVYTGKGVVAQSRYDEISGLDKKTHFAGAYWGYGFHEDGVQSALRVCRAFGKTL